MITPHAEAVHMKKQMVFTAGIIAMLCATVLIGVKGYAQERTERFDNLEMRYQTANGRDWYIASDYAYSLTSTNGNRNRSWHFKKSGFAWVFVGTSDYDRMSKSTGSRCYQLLPFKEPQEPTWYRKDAATVEAMLPSGHRALFSTETAELIELEGYTVATTPLQHFDQMVKAQGGVELRPLKGYLLIDYGWQSGGMGISYLWRSAAICDASGAKCTIKNSDVYIKDPRDSDEVIFTINTGIELDRFLKAKCPKLAR
jgi:hypothetical protein